MPTQDDAEINSINARVLAERVQQAGPPDWGKLFQEDTTNEAEAEALRQKMEQALATRFPDPDLVTIPVSDDIYIQYDRHDTWFAIGDKDNLGYDEMGAVLMGYEELDELIEKLQEFKRVLEEVSKILPFICMGYCDEPSPQFIDPKAPPVKSTGFDGTLKQAVSLGWSFSADPRWTKGISNLVALCPECTKGIKE